MSKKNQLIDKISIFVQLAKKSFMKINLLDNQPMPFRIFLHSLFWVSYVCFFGFLWGSYDGAYVREFSIMLIELPVKMVIVYVNLYILIPRFLLTRKYAEFITWILLTMVLGGAVQRGVAYYFIYPTYYPDALTGYWNVVKIVKYGVGMNTVVFFTTLVKIMKYWYKDQIIAQNLAHEKLEAELKLLKGQIHPHFLFNTLNNLYSLTLKKADCAPEVVLKLSELMDYMLYDANAPQLSLKKEINYIKNYISLEKIRYGDRADISFDVKGEVESYQIAPLLLLPFIENSFKHGVSGEIEKDWISLDL